MNNVKYKQSVNFLGLFSAYGENNERLILMCVCLWYIALAHSLLVMKQL
jgi:hypothetical protein